MMNLSKLFGRWSAVGALLLAGLYLAGCQTASDPRFSNVPGLTPAPAAAAAEAAPSAALAATASPPASPSEIGNDEQVMHAGDAVTITFTDLPYAQPDINDRIKDDGTLTLIQNQTFVAAGKTRRELEKEIRERYVPNIFKTMTVIVQPQTQTQFYYVGGEVKQPGRQVYLAHITVLRAIQSAGDFTDFAKKTKVQLTRRDGRTFKVNCVKALRDPRLDLEVYPGDTITVPRRWF